MRLIRISRRYRQSACAPWHKNSTSTCQGSNATAPTGAIDLLAVLGKEGLIGVGGADAEVNDAFRALAAGVPKPTSAKPKIFLVHGRNDGLKNELGRWLGRIGFDDVILHEQPNVGRTLITKFEEVAKDVAYAVVLMTPDDVGGSAGEGQRYRARQNVIFELGYFIWKLGGPRVAAVVVGDIEKPSDYQGVVYIPYDPAGGWKVQLARQFKVLGLPFDLMAGLSQQAQPASLPIVEPTQKGSCGYKYDMKPEGAVILIRKARMRSVRVKHLEQAMEVALAVRLPLIAILCEELDAGK